MPTVTRIGPDGRRRLLELAANISLAEETLAFSEALLLPDRGYGERDIAALHVVLARLGEAANWNGRHVDGR